MARVFCLALLALISTLALSAEVTPIEKVIQLIEEMKKEVVNEGKDEGESYNKFACFCKDVTVRKSGNVKKLAENINDLSADIEEKTNKKKEDSTELAERKGKQEKLSKDLDETIARCAKEKAEYEAEAADMSKAISSLKGAIKSMKESNKAASLLAIKSVVTTFSKMTLTQKQQRVTSLLQQRVDPGSPGYEFHSNDIISLCEDMLEEFKGSKSTLDDEWGKTSKGCAETKSSLGKDLASNKDAMAALDKAITKGAEEIAKHREELVQDNDELKDEQLYLKDLQARCEDRANDYDQRSTMRGQELGAIQQALDILTKSVKDRADDVNQRALLQTEVKAAPAAAVKAKALSFVQEVLVKKHSLRGGATDALELEAKKNRALDMLRSEGRRMGSVTIQALTLRVAADPFKKVKELIQKLVERLLQESAAEATKKGFCDTEIAEAEHDRDARFKEAHNLNRELKALEAREDELTEEIKELTDQLADENKDLKEVTSDREDEKAENLKTLKTAKEGLDAVTDALQVLKSFYSQAAKASFLQASPVDEDTKGPGFSGSYKGKQGSSNAILALLETIQSDFDRTLRTTEEAEHKAHREYVKFSQTSKASIGGKETKKDLDEQDLKSTKTQIETKTNDLQSNVDLLDKALKELEALKPQCIDTGMSYKERVQKREDEMAALKKALQILS